MYLHEFAKRCLCYHSYLLSAVSHRAPDSMSSATIAKLRIFFFFHKMRFQVLIFAARVWAQGTAAPKTVAAPSTQTVVPPPPAPVTTVPVVVTTPPPAPPAEPTTNNNPPPPASPRTQAPPVQAAITTTTQPNQAPAAAAVTQPANNPVQGSPNGGTTPTYSIC